MKRSRLAVIEHVKRSRLAVIEHVKRSRLAVIEHVKRSRLAVIEHVKRSRLAVIEHVKRSRLAVIEHVKRSQLAVIEHVKRSRLAVAKAIDVKSTNSICCLFYSSQTLLDEYSRLIQRLAEVDSEDCTAKMSFYTATLHRALQKKNSSDHAGIFHHCESSSSLDNALDASGTWTSMASNLSEEDPDGLTSSMTSLTLSRRMTRSRSLDDMLNIDMRKKRVTRKTTLKRRVGSSKFYTEQMLNALNTGMNI